MAQYSLDLNNASIKRQLKLKLTDNDMIGKSNTRKTYLCTV